MIDRGYRLVVIAAVFSAIAIGAGARADNAPVAFRRLSLERGLSQSIVYSMMQNRNGFLYFATEDGLNRFDGYSFTVDRPSATDANTLSHTELRSVTEDAAGVVWVGTFGGGLDSLDPATGAIRRYLHDDSNPDSIAANLVRCVLADRAGAIWVGTQGSGLDRFDPATGRFAHFRHDPAEPGTIASNDIRALYTDAAGALWVGTQDAGLDRLDAATGRFAHHRNRDGDDASLGHDTVTAIVEGRAGMLWVGTLGGGLCALDRTSGRFTRVRARPGDAGALASDLVSAVFEDHDGTLWVGTDGAGLARYDREARTFATFRHDPADSRSLTADRIRSLMEDRSHVLWVGTYGGGLSALDLTHKRFAHYRHDPANSNSLSHNIVWSIYEDAAGILWIGTDSGGLNRLDRRSGQYRHYRHDPSNPDSLANDAVRVVAPSRSGALWIGTNGGGLDRFDPVTERFAHYRRDPADPASLSHDELRAVYEDTAGAVWVGTYGGGLERLDPATGHFTHHRHDPAADSSISSDFVRGILEDTRGALWIGTHDGGADRLDRATGRFSHHRASATDPTSIGGNSAFSFLEDRTGALWVATYGTGVSRLDRATGAFTRFATADGLASNSTYGLLEDGDGFIWISTNAGLSRLDPRTGAFRNFDVADGLQSNEFNGGALFKSTSGELFFGGINGLNAFYPNQIGLNTEPPPVVITDLQIANRSVRVGEVRHGRVTLTRPVEYSEAVIVSYRDPVITFEFAALHYTAPEKNRYAYRLEGFGNDWIPATSDRRFATFTGLAPGSYVFRVKAANSDGFWNERGAALRLTVEPPFWATWWSRIGAALLLAGLAALALHRRVAHVRVVAELKAAHDAQMAIMPHASPSVAGFDIAGCCVAANEVGGDFFDYLRLGGDDGPLCIAIGDVSGKAMGAAMSAVMASGVVAARADSAEPLAEAMTAINRVLHRKAPQHMFTALCLAAIDEGARTLTFVNAGLCPPLLKRGGGAVELTSVGPSLPLGPIADTAYESRTVPLAPGDVVVLHTDGIPEATDHAGEFYGYERVQAQLARLDAGAGAAGIRDAILADVARFAGGSHRHDDMAVVVVKCL